MEVQLYSTIRQRYVTVLDCLERVNTFLAEKRQESRRSASRHVTPRVADDNNESRDCRTPSAVLPSVRYTKTDVPAHLAVYDHLMRTKYQEHVINKSLPALPQRGKWAQQLPYEYQPYSASPRPESRLAVRPAVLRFGGSTLLPQKHPQRKTPGLPEDWKLKGKGGKAVAAEGHRTARKTKTRHPIPFVASVSARKDVTRGKEDATKEVKQSYICISQPLQTPSATTPSSAKSEPTETPTAPTEGEDDDTPETDGGNKDNSDGDHEEEEDPVEDPVAKEASPEEDSSNTGTASREDDRSSQTTVTTRRSSLKDSNKGLTPRFKLPRKVTIVEPTFILEQKKSKLSTSTETDVTLDFIITNSSRQT